MKKIRRIDAIAAGLKKYFTEKPCKKGHVVERYTTNGKCVECQAEYSKTEKVKANLAKYKQGNKKKQAQFYVGWYARNKDKKLEYMREYNKTVALPKVRQRYREDLVFAVATRARARLVKAIQRAGYAKNGKTQELIGCSFQALVEHIEKQFQTGMSWSNRDKWHIDHIIPVASARSEEELLSLFHFTNLRPLWAEENRRKSAKVEHLL
jgi:hypothetical protein